MLSSVLIVPTRCHSILSPSPASRFRLKTPKPANPACSNRIRLARRARLAPSREGHWMNRERGRLRQAMDREMRFAVIVGARHGVPLQCKAPGLANRNGPSHSKRGPKRRITPRVPEGERRMSCRIREMGRILRGVVKISVYQVSEFRKTVLRMLMKSDGLSHGLANTCELQ
jgi:hypothetical protein